LRHALVVLHGRYNRCSVPPLLASLEESGLCEELDVTVVRVSERRLSDAAPALYGAVREALRRADRVVLALTVTTWVAMEAMGVLRRLRRECGGRLVAVAGGPHASGDPWGTIEVLGFDYAVVGEGELSLPRLLAEVVEGGDPEGVEGVASKARPSPRRPRPVELDESRPYSLRYRAFAPAIEIMRGCPHACKFCQTPRIMGHRPRYRSVDSVVEAVEVLVREFGWRDVRFVAPNGFAYGSRDGATPDPERLRDLLEAVRSVEGVRRVYLGTFPSEVRPESVTPEVLEAVRGLVDNRRLSIGVQSGSDKVLEAVGRGHTVEDGLRAVRCARAYGFLPYVDVLCGLPGETEEDVRMTLRLIREVIRQGGKVRLHTFVPLPGTPLWREDGAPLPDFALEAFRAWVAAGAAEGDYEEQLRMRMVISAYKRISEGLKSLREGATHLRG